MTPNITCRLALGMSISEKNLPALELFSEDDGQEINRYTLFGEHELVLTSLFFQWCFDNGIKVIDYNSYFLAHLNRGVELLTNRVKGLEDIVDLLREP